MRIIKNKEKIELTKEELMILIEGLDVLDDMEYVSFDEYNIHYQEFRKKLSDIFYKLEWL